jgi:DNA-damage-inducible protein J
MSASTCELKSATVRARIEPSAKAEAEGILRDLGLSPSMAVSALYRQIIARRGLPFPVEIPNARTVVAMEAVRRGEVTPSSLEDIRTLWESSDEG